LVVSQIHYRQTNQWDLQTLSAKRWLDKIHFERRQNSNMRGRDSSHGGI
jgi:hypothetical protein